MLRSPPATRRGQSAAYLLFAGAGAGAALFPAPSVTETASSKLLVGMWVGFLILGGLASAVGRILGRWVGEFVGIPLLAFAFLIYACSIIYTTIMSGRLTGITAGLALGALFCLVAARWFEVNMIRQEAVNTGRVERGVPMPEETKIRGHRREEAM